MASLTAANAKTIVLGLLTRHELELALWEAQAVQAVHLGLVRPVDVLNEADTDWLLCNSNERSKPWRVTIESSDT